MSRLIPLLAVIAIGYILYRRIQSLPPHLRRAETVRTMLIVTVVGVVLLTLAGKMHWIGAALAGLLVAVRQSLPLLIRLFPFMSQFLQQKASAASGASTVKTRVLVMHLDHESGALSGEVQVGPYAKWLLAEMSREQLQELRAYCEHEDPESVELLDSYLAQRFPGEDAARAGSTEQNKDSGKMNRQEALQILGLADTATREEIIAAHRKLMQKLHPDRGGNDYLAAKINAAKDFLTE